MRGSLHNAPCIIPRVAFLQVVVVVPNKHAIRVRNNRLLRIGIKHSVQSELRAARRGDRPLTDQKLLIVMKDITKQTLPGNLTVSGNVTGLLKLTFVDLSMIETP
jgi:hypothetical protein